MRSIEHQGGSLNVLIKRGTVVVTAIFIALTPAIATAENASEVNNQLQNANHMAAEASQKISDTDAQIAQVEGQINDTQAKVDDTNAAIADAKERMAVNQATLNAMVRREYQKNRESGLEMLASSKDFSEFVNRDAYLKTSQSKIADLVDQVLKIKKELDLKAADLNKLNTQLAAAEKGLVFARAQAQGQLDVVNAQREDLKKKLARYGGQVVNVGDHVNTGDLVGFEGTSGCSTGPHLHFEVDQNNKPVNPREFAPSRFHWPLDTGFGISQEFGRPSWNAPYDFHTGIDISQFFGAPVYAAASGTVKFSGYDRTGFGDHVIIDHGGGLQTIYGHMGARGSDYPSC